MSTAPIFAPDGALGDIPQAELAAAIRAGAKPGVNIIAPDGSKGVVPADRYVDAVKAGAKVAPFEDQDIKHPGFWSALYDDVKGMIPTKVQFPFSDTTNAEDDAADAARKAAGYSTAYRNLAPLGQNLGVNVPGMEQSAKEGDAWGVAGHAAAVPAVMAATEGLARGAPVIARGASVAADAVKPAVKVVAARVPEVAGGAAGAYLGHATGIPQGGLLGAIAGRTLGKNLWESISDVYQSWRNRGDATGTNQPYAGETSPSPTVAPQKLNLRNLNGEGSPEAVSQPAPVSSSARVEEALNSALGGKPLQKNVPLRQQMPARAPKPAALPEGFTPIESSLLRGYKYDPATQEFTAMLNNGETYTHGEVTPTQVREFQDAQSQGAAWTKKIKQGAGTVLTKKNGSPVKTGTMEVAPGKVAPKSEAGMFDDLTSIIEQSLADAQAGKTQ